MYRYSQTLPGGPITLVGILALSFLLPGWAANVLGYSAANAQLVGWILSHRVVACIPLLLLYGLGGFALLVGAGMAIYAGYFVLVRALVAVRNWAVRTTVAIAQLLGVLLCWVPEVVVQLLCDQIESGRAKLTAYRQERQELRRLYREDFAQDFPSYRAFLCHWRALQAAEQAKTDPLQQAIRLMGLEEPFTRDDLKRRFHILIAGIHPDRVGPNELAAQLIAANTLISERMNWS
jgi:hypothetical protein